MPKMIVETVGPYICMGSTMNGLDAVPHDRPAVVLPTNYIQQKAASGAVRILKQGLPDTASDADFLAFWVEAKGDTELAVESYAASLEDDMPTPLPAPTPAKKAQ